MCVCVCSEPLNVSDCSNEGQLLHAAHCSKECGRAGCKAQLNTLLTESPAHLNKQVAETVSSNAAVILYDWRVFTLQELLRSVKKVLGGGTVLSIAVVAPGSKPGTVGE